MSHPSRYSLALLITAWAISGISLPGQTSTQTSPTTPNSQQQTPSAPHVPRPNPDASGRYHIGDGVTVPKLIHNVLPEYPRIAKKEKMSVRCHVSLTLKTDGVPENVHVSSLDPDLSEKKMQKIADAFEDSCTKAVQQWRFEPAKYQDNPVPIDLKIDINFNIF